MSDDSKPDKETKKEYFQRILRMREESEKRFVASQNLNEILLHGAHLQRMNDRINQYFLDSIDSYSRRLHWLTVGLVIISGVLAFETLELIFRAH